MTQNLLGRVNFLQRLYREACSKSGETDAGTTVPASADETVSGTYLYMTPNLSERLDFVQRQN